MNIRARFEEIWPVPAGVAWNENFSEYCPIGGTFTAKCLAEEWDARLDTFTRCQETTDIYVSLIQEMVDELSQDPYPGGWYYRAKQILEQKK